jgi:hypothetical protein
MACSVQGRVKKERQLKNKVKSNAHRFFNIKGIVHKEFILAGQTVSSAYYCDCVKMGRDFDPNFDDK